MTSHTTWSKARFAETISSIRSGARLIGVRGVSWLPEDGMLQDAVEAIVAKLDEKPTVDTTDTPANGEVLTYDSASGKYKPSASGSAPVSSVFTRTGAVAAASGDYTASQVTNTPAGNIAATTAQCAINELDSEKTPTTRTISTTAPLAGGGDLSANRTLTVGAASETATGVAEIATQTETDTGTDDARFVTPLKLATTPLGMLNISRTEVSITGSATLTSTAFGKMHVCSGTSADYTVTLPAVSGNGGKIIAFRGAGALTKLVTLDGNSTETINGALTLVITSREAVKLLCTGSEWVTLDRYKVSRHLQLRRVADLSIPNNSWTAITWDTEDLDELEWWTSGTSININKTGKFMAYVNSSFASNATGIRGIRITRAGAEILAAPIVGASIDDKGRCAVAGPLILSAGETITVDAYQNSGAAINLSNNSGTTPTSSVRIYEV